tara:strand:+ start:234 stop:605 length:372 start_codon:yes stop_codon:yes gene_type:complete
MAETTVELMHWDNSHDITFNSYNHTSETVTAYCKLREIVENSDFHVAVWDASCADEDYTMVRTTEGATLYHAGDVVSTARRRGAEGRWEAYEAAYLATPEFPATPRVHRHPLAAMIQTVSQII